MLRENGRECIKQTISGNCSNCCLPFCRKRKKKAAVSHPLLAVSSQQSRDIISLRAEQLLRPAPAVSMKIGDGAEDDDIPCTPAFCSSELDRGVGVVDALPVIPALKDEDNNLFVSDADDDSALPEGKVYPKAMLSYLLLASCGRSGTHPGEMISPPDSLGLSVSSPPDEGDDGDAGDAGDAGGTVPVGEVSLVEELQHVNYHTLWQLGSSDLHSGRVKEFYVPALSSAVSPLKVSTGST